MTMGRRTPWSGPTRIRSSVASCAVEVEDGEGHKGRDKVVLEAFEITEISEVASVLLEAGVYDRKGRFVSGLTLDQLRRPGRRRRAGDRSRQPRARAGDVRAAHRQQPEHVAPLRLREGRGRAADGLPPAEDTVVVAPFAKRLRRADRSDRRSPHHHRGDPAHRADRRHGHPRCADRAQRAAAARPRTAAR